MLASSRRIKIHISDNVVDTKRYWDFSETNYGTNRLNEEECIREFRRLVQQAAGRRVDRNGRTAIFLSGGLDSSTAAVTAYKYLQHSNPSKHLFSISGVFDHNRSADERTYIDATHAAMGNEIESHRLRTDSYDDSPTLNLHSMRMDLQQRLTLACCATYATGRSTGRDGHSNRSRRRLGDKLRPSSMDISGKARSANRLMRDIARTENELRPLREKQHGGHVIWPLCAQLLASVGVDSLVACGLSIGLPASCCDPISPLERASSNDCTLCSTGKTKPQHLRSLTAPHNGTALELFDRLCAPLVLKPTICSTTANC